MLKNKKKFMIPVLAMLLLVAMAGTAFAGKAYNKSFSSTTVWTSSTASVTVKNYLRDNNYSCYKIGTAFQASYMSQGFIGGHGQDEASIYSGGSHTWYHSGTETYGYLRFKNRDFPGFSLQVGGAVE